MRAVALPPTRNMDGTVNMTFTATESETRAFLDGFNALAVADVDVNVKPYRVKRSLSANAYCWVLVDKIAAALNVPKAAVYRLAIREIGGVSDVVCVPEKAADRLCESWSNQGIGWQTERMDSKIEGCVNVVLYYGSSVFDAKQMSALVDSLVQEAKALGIETLSPAELARMESAWQARTGEKRSETA